MPIYEYRCAECGEKFEKLVRMSNSDQQVVCPKCGAENARRQVSAFGFLGGSTSSIGSGSSCAPSGGG